MRRRFKSKHSMSALSEWQQVGVAQSRAPRSSTWSKVARRAIGRSQLPFMWIFLCLMGYKIECLREGCLCHIDRAANF